MKIRWNRAGQKPAWAAIMAAGLFLAAALGARLWIGPLPGAALHPPPSPVVLDHKGRPLRFFLAPDDQWRFYVPLKELDPLLVRSEVAFEDRWFYYHPGVNPFALVRALVQNLESGRIISGGSTLTMQVARMLEHRPRTYQSKLAEILRALQLELHYSKPEILGLYFNLAPYGGNIQGVAAASRIYFGKSPDRLGPAEIALLVALPQSPETRRPDLHPEESRPARNRVLARLLAQGLVSADEYRRGIDTPVPKSRISPTIIAPHLSEMLVSRVDENGRVLSTIDLDLQLFCEKKLKARAQRLKERGIKNAALVLIENKTGTVRALIGSPDFFDVPSQGQVNAALAPRSPGSTLKPFLYARALDRGLVSPSLLLPDVPTAFGDYEPENYDNTFRGMVSMHDALVNSLNVPAVALEALLKQDGVWSILRDAKFKSIRQDRNYYGLSLVLGGCGVNLLELTNLYASLARGGIWMPSRLVAKEPMPPGKRFFSRGSAYIITGILSELKRPDFPNEFITATNLPVVALKTGTSSGRKDAWSIGYDPEWTIGVWAGNADGSGNPDLVGAQSAAPLLIEIFDALCQGRRQEWFERPPEVGFRPVCALSGMIPGPNCPETKQEMYIYNVSPTGVCNFHEKYDIDSRTGFRLCSFCRQGRKYLTRTFVKWPQQVANWMKANNIVVLEIPSHLPSCPHQDSGKPPQIISPKPDDHFLLREGVRAGLQQIKLRAAVDNRVQSLYWFVDGKMIYQGPAGATVFYFPTPGRHQLVCLDEEGRKASISFSVE